MAAYGEGDVPGEYIFIDERAIEGLEPYARSRG
jgi:hypothetical protein